MANRQLFKKIKSIKDFRAYQPSSEGFKEMIFELIRLDVPVLEIGSSSIGKSYSIRDFMDKCGVAAEFLFVGTEKSEFIEGIPNLKAVAGATEKAGEQKFSYLKPYWFPDKNVIRAKLKSGRAQLNGLTAGGRKELGDMWAKAKTNYDELQTLKRELTKIRRNEEDLRKAKEKGQKLSKFIYSDALGYISMVQGFGNFWLILDEIDKVEKQDKDKYAPLLHIVRERELKGWKLSGLRDYPEYDIKYATTVDDRITRLDKALENEEVDITDTRIVGIANDLQVMEEEAPALYRRFVKTVIDRSLYDENQFSAEAASVNSKQRQKDLEADPGLSYQVKRNEFHSCIAIKDITSKGKTVKELMAEIDAEKVGRPLDELNLAWTLGFLPDMLFPGVDTSKQAAGKELFVPNLFIRDWNETEDPFKTYLYKIIGDNFAPDYWIALLECIDNLVSYQKEADSTAGTLKEKAMQMLKDGGLTTANFNDPPKKGVDQVLKRYDALLHNIEDQLKGLGAAAQKELRDKGFQAQSQDLGGISGSILIVAQENIQLGGMLIEETYIDNKRTALTNKLLSAIPFIQNRLISSSPYISHTYAQDMMNYMNDTAIKIVKKQTGRADLSIFALEEEAKKLFDTVEVDKDYLIQYACGLSPKEVEKVKELKINSPAVEKQNILNIIFENRPVIIYDSLVAKLDDDQKVAYYSNLAPAKMIEKEVFSNLPKILEMAIEEYRKDAKAPANAQGLLPSINEIPLTIKLKDSLKYYTDRFPNNMMALSESPRVVELQHLWNFIQINSEAAKEKGTATEIDIVNSFQEA